MSALDRLAERLGIEPAFQNAANERQETTKGTKRDLLAAMGIMAVDEASAGAILAERVADDWSKPLPPVLVHRLSAGDVVVTIALPASIDTISWTLTEENGAARDGRERFGDLELLETTSADGRALERRLLVLKAPSSVGYHRLRIDPQGGGTAEMPLIAVPDRCYVPDGLEGDRQLWGISAQLYLLRSSTNWGIGDFSDLRRFVEISADLGAAVIGLNPLHAMFLDDPEHASPYSPASRLFLNVLYIDPTVLPEWDGSDEPAAEAAALRETATVEYARVAPLKLAVLEELFGRFLDRAVPDRREAFEAFRRGHGGPLEQLCRYQALREHFVEEAGGPDWRHWPEEFRRPDGSAVARFAEENCGRIDFFAWTQWVADEQLGAAAAAAASLGMPVGLYRDLAVGADMAGAETWSRPDVVVAKAHVGGPPDLYNPAGQDWGLPPFNPEALHLEAYSGFIDLVRANMRHAGGLRIDHVMALQHLYWIPEGQSPEHGAYVSYPMADLVGILALESQRHRCLVVGEDLGTVPEGFRERMEEAGILSYRVLIFEQDPDGRFIPPEGYPSLALATAGSHDLATLRGWWEERDIDLKDGLGLYPDEYEAVRQRQQRAEQRVALLEALRAADIALPQGFESDAPYEAELSDAVNRFLIRTRSGLVMVQLDELTDEADQVNLPGTDGEHPNWRRKQSMTLEEIATRERVREGAANLAEARPTRTRK